MPFPKQMLKHSFPKQRLVIAQLCDLRLNKARPVQIGLHLTQQDGYLLQIIAKSNLSGEALSLNVIPVKEAAALTAPLKPCSVLGGTN